MESIIYILCRVWITCGNYYLHIMSLMDISTETEETVWENPLERGEDDVAEEEEGEWEEGEEGDGGEGDEAGEEEVEGVAGQEESAAGEDVGNGEDGGDGGGGEETKKRCSVGEIAKEGVGASKRRRA
jgi:hypothetical protein